MPHPDGHNQGVYFGPEDAQLPGHVKDTFKHRRDPFSMSSEIRHALRMHVTAQRALDDVGLASQFVGEGRKEARSAESRKRQFIRQAVLEKASRDFGYSISEADTETIFETEADSNGKSNSDTESPMQR
jgi:hypothetical protein